MQQTTNLYEIFYKILGERNNTSSSTTTTTTTTTTSTTTRTTTSSTNSSEPPLLPRGEVKFHLFVKGPDGSTDCIPVFSEEDIATAADVYISLSENHKRTMLMKEPMSCVKGVKMKGTKMKGVEMKGVDLPSFILSYSGADLPVDNTPVSNLGFGPECIIDLATRRRFISPALGDIVHEKKEWKREGRVTKIEETTETITVGFRYGPNRKVNFSKWRDEFSKKVRDEPLHSDVHRTYQDRIHDPSGYFRDGKFRTFRYYGMEDDWANPDRMFHNMPLLYPPGQTWENDLRAPALIFGNASFPISFIRNLCIAQPTPQRWDLSPQYTSLSDSLQGMIASLQESLQDIHHYTSEGDARRVHQYTSGMSMTDYVSEGKVCCHPKHNMRFEIVDTPGFEIVDRREKVMGDIVNAIKQQKPQFLIFVYQIDGHEEEEKNILLAFHKCNLRLKPENLIVIMNEVETGEFNCEVETGEFGGGERIEEEKEGGGDSEKLLEERKRIAEELERICPEIGKFAEMDEENEKSNFFRIRFLKREDLVEVRKSECIIGELREGPRSDFDPFLGDSDFVEDEMPIDLFWNEKRCPIEGEMYFKEEEKEKKGRGKGEKEKHCPTNYLHVEGFLRATFFDDVLAYMARNSKIVQPIDVSEIVTPRLSQIVTPRLSPIDVSQIGTVA